MRAVPCADLGSGKGRGEREQAGRVQSHKGRGREGELEQ